MSAREPSPVRLLMVEDREDHAELIVATLRRAGIPVAAHRVDSASGLSRALDAEAAELVILDCSMPDFSGPEAMEMIRRRGIDLPCVVVSATLGEERAVEMMRAGASDYVMKDNLMRLPAVVERELRDAAERRARREVERKYSGLNDRLSGFMRAADALLVVVAGTDGVITDWNEGAERMLGRRAEEVVGRADLTIAHDADEIARRADELGVPAGVEALLADARRGATDAAELTYVHRDGSRIPVTCTIAAIRDERGAVTGFVQMARDISARRRHEAEQEALRRVALEVAAEPEPGDILARVAEEAAALLGADAAGVIRFEGSQGVGAAASAGPGMAPPPEGQPVPLDGTGPVALVARGGRCAASEDVRADETSAAGWGGPPEVRALTACPVRADGRLWGALWAGARGSGAFDADASERLARFADLVGLAVSNAEARERVVSNTLAGIFRGDLAPSDILDTIVTSARRALGSDRATCYVLTEEGDTAQEVHTTETDPQRRAFIMGAVERPRAAMPVWRLLMDGEHPTMIVEDVASDPAIPEAVSSRLGSGAIVGLRLEHPSVRRGGRPVMLGALFLSYRRPRRFSARERTAAESLAGMAAVALANTRLHEATVRTAAEAAARSTADPLTGLANHRAFQERLAQEVTRARRHRRSLSLALIDLDRFRAVNEQHGHQVGDRVLVEIAARLRSLARDTDLVARVGGEEIAWLMPETEAMEAWQAVDRAREAVARTPMETVGRVTVSAGVCDLAQAGSAGELLRLAEGALYWAKQHGRDVAFLYSPEVVEVLSAEERAERLQRFQALQSIRVLARAVDAKDPSTRQHSERVADLAVAIATRLGWESEPLMRLREAGLVHDVGKIGVPDRILFKPARLTPAEYQEIIRHAEIGAEMVADVLTPEQVAWVRGHHERWDGRGYPDGIADQRIPWGARILALADAWDVMTSERPYHQPLSVEDALAEIRRCSGSQFCAEVVESMERLVRARALPAARAG